MSTRLLAAVAAGVVALTACVTPYKPSGLGGGFSDSRLDAHTFRVHARGNGYTPADRVQNIALFRCAELTLTNGFDYFVLLDASNSATQAYYSTPSTYTETTTATANAYGRTVVGQATTTGRYTPGVTIPVTRHGADVMFRAFAGAKPPDPNAFDAMEVVRYLGPSVAPARAQELLDWATSERAQPAQR